MGPSFSWLFGPRTYDDMVGKWNAVGGPFKHGLTAVDKCVVSRGTPADLTWPNSSLFTGDVTACSADLRERHEGHLVVMRSGELLRSLLLPAGSMNTLLLIVHPIVLGSGERLFGGERRFDLALETVMPARGGLVLAQYRS